MTRRHTLLAIAALAVATLVAPVERALRAQGAAIRADSIATVLARIPVGSVVRVGAGELVMEGTLRPMTHDRVRVALASGEETSATLASVDRIWVPEGVNSRRATQVGVMVGGAIGLLLGASIGGLWCESGRCTADRISSAVAGAAVGSALGAIGGRLIGGTATGWRRVFP